MDEDVRRIRLWRRDVGYIPIGVARADRSTIQVWLKYGRKDWIAVELGTAKCVGELLPPASEPHPPDVLIVIRQHSQGALAPRYDVIYWALTV